MDLRTRTVLFCAALALAIAMSVLLRAKTQRLQLLFAAFAADVGLWYLTQGLFGFNAGQFWARATELLAVLMPLLATRLFHAIVPRPPDPQLVAPTSLLPAAAAARAPTLDRVTTVLSVPMIALILSPYHQSNVGRVVLFLYVVVLTSAALYRLGAEGRASKSRAVVARTRFLVTIGAFATAFSLADFLWWVGARLPPVGAVLSIVFLFVLSQSLQSSRLLDLYDLAGRLMVATALAFCLAGIFYVFITWVGRFNTMYLNAVLASIAILVLFNPLQAKVEAYIHQIFFRERFDLERAVGELRRGLAHVLELREMVDIALEGLERSRRVTSAAIFLRDDASSEPGGAAYLVQGHIGEPPRVVRIEETSSRALVERLSSRLPGRGTIVLEEVERELAEAANRGDTHAMPLVRELYTRLTDIGGGAVFPIQGDQGELFGILVVADDRVRDAFSPEEITLLESLAGQLATVFENSRAYGRIKERDRLAALGAMAAGIAHEVKNPLGSIKGAAQLLAESAHDGATIADPEFLGIILEEVERLDRVVSSILDYARPRSDSVDSIDINAAVQRTMQILEPARDPEVDMHIALAEGLPRARIDPEQLRQVLMNLVTNAIQAMGSQGRVSVTTQARRSFRSNWSGAQARGADDAGAVEIRVADTGPGISNKVLKNLFVPFFTTKSTGTGLGLAISQRIVQNAGGAIEVQTSAGVGTTFTVVLPAAGG